MIFQTTSILIHFLLTIFITQQKTSIHAFIVHHHRRHSFIEPLKFHAKPDVVSVHKKKKGHGYYYSSRTSSTSTSSSTSLFNWFFTNDTTQQTKSNDSSTKEQNKVRPSSSSSSSKQNGLDASSITILDKIGSGSYGTVHYCQFNYENSSSNSNKKEHDDPTTHDQNNIAFYVAKRAWTLAEVQEMNEKQSLNSYHGIDYENDGVTKEISKDSLVTTTTTASSTSTLKKLKEKVKRCNHYLNVEEHCLLKMQSKQSNKNNNDDDDDDGKKHLPNYVGRFQDCTDGHEWLVFDLITSNSSANNDHESKIEDKTTRTATTAPASDTKTAAKSLNQVMLLDWKNQHNKSSSKEQILMNENADHHHLSMIHQELGLSHYENNYFDTSASSSSSTFEKTLDVIMESLLKILVDIHEHRIVHRDLKPDNLLIDGRTNSLVLIDFGSAADMDPIKAIGGFGKRVGLDDAIVAVSPIYAAPETFVKVGEEAFRFDVFSAGLIFCQLLFNLLDERTDAAFRQQLQESNYDLDLWLEREMQSTIRPAGFDDGMLFLADRVGLWKLLKDMLQPNPIKRVSSKRALARFDEIMTRNNGEQLSDGAFFETVIENFEVCSIPDWEGANEEGTKETTSFMKPRPLHYAMTFNRKSSLGLVLSEPLADDENEIDIVDESRITWEMATQNAQDGEVFVREIVQNGQAEKMGIIEVGDRLVGVGDFPFTNNGFEGFIHMLESVPGNAKTIKVHFDRLPKARQDIKNEPRGENEIKITSQGAFSTKGKRNSNEDAVILQEIQNDELQSVLLGGVFDGHGGDAASKTASQILPSLFSTKVELSDLGQALESAWDETCETYKEGCTIYGSCVADYDPREGVLLAGTGSKDWVAGTTASIAAFSSQNDRNELVVLNCGDSRTLIVGEPKDKSMSQSYLHFATQDHSPKSESEYYRLQTGKESGLDYSLPQCSVNRWWIKVGDYQYAVSRSLEGEFASSKGIVSDADVEVLDLSRLVQLRNDASLVIASDGLFEVYDNEFIAKEVATMRGEGTSAKDVAKQLCLMALEKGTTDNVSVVVWYFDEL